ncbi:hypothetical protein [uncultured Croceicoccus sp.]|uniref:lysozyme n=1 Tax=uncultured Croceicoccus sp. TaxID=1295329 RepID=UPI002629D673|nr:hypothetical protein [uncultured Croceicoccus sp.]
MSEICKSCGNVITAPSSGSARYDPSAPHITPRIAAELIAHEGIVREAYRDSVGVWTWSVGLTDACGHGIRRYRDNPQDLDHCMAIYAWALRERYLPAVLDAFGDHAPAEHELGGALSFHWNTGAIRRAEWMRRFRDGDVAGARDAIMNWCRPAVLTKRRRCEQALFFDGTWTNDGHATVYDVAKPSYRPTAGRRVEILSRLERLSL